MLMRFGVSNYRSIREYQEISLVASTLKGGDANTFEFKGAMERLLPFTMVYGANASGKTNLLRSLAFFRDSIVKSHNAGTPTGKIPRHPFALDDQ